MGDELALDEASEAPAAEPPASAWTEGAKTILFIRVDFSDMAGDPVSESAAKTLIDTTVNGYFVDASFGKASLSASVTPTLRSRRKLNSSPSENMRKTMPSSESVLMLSSS